MELGDRMKIIYFDTETTGLDCHNNQIIELAMITVIDGEIVDEYDKFISFDESLPPKIIYLTGITDEMLKIEGVSEESIAKDLKERLTEGTLMIAHNCNFDLSFVYNLLKRYYPDEADEIVENLNFIDTVTVLKDRKDYPHKLSDAVEHYDIGEVNFHRGIDDTKALHKVVKAMKEERNDLKEYLNIFGYNPRYGIEQEQFPFIEYKRQYYHNRGFINQNEILPRI